ncbi:MAG TPA: hypothetical protein VF628_10240 [Allosphingosinicella sp.]|jgi:hypothetical protein
MALTPAAAQPLALALLILPVSAATPAPVQTLPARWHLTPDGLGRIRIGMTQHHVTRALGADLLVEPDAGEISENCVESRPRGWKALWLMFEDGKLTRITVREPSRLTTPRGIGAGSSEPDVRRAYGFRLKSEPHHYESSPARYLTYWTAAGKRGVRFEIGSSGHVEAIHAGSQAIEYVEGCL